MILARRQCAISICSTVRPSLGTHREESFLFTSAKRLPAHHRDLTDAQWTTLETLIPEPAPHRDGRGRPWKDRRAVLDGILWVLRTGAPWADVPNRYPSYQTTTVRLNVEENQLVNAFGEFGICLGGLKGA